MPLEFQIHESSQAAYLRLFGSLDDTATIEGLLEQVTRKTLFVDTARVGRVTSSGVCSWVAWLDELQRRDIAVYLVECSPAIVAQLSQVANFDGHATVLSFRAPYYCGKCEHESTRVITVEEIIHASSPRAPRCFCERCGARMELDEVEGNFFSWLAGLRSPVLAPGLRADLAALACEEALPRRTHTAVRTPSSQLFRALPLQSRTPTQSGVRRLPESAIGDQTAPAAASTNTETSALLSVEGPTEGEAAIPDQVGWGNPLWYQRARYAALILLATALVGLIAAAALLF